MAHCWCTVQYIVLREPLLSVHSFTSPSIQTCPIFCVWIGEAKTCNTQKTERLFCNWYCWHILNIKIKPMMKNKHILDCFCFFCLLTNSHSKWGETNLSQLSPLSSTFQMSSIWKIPNKIQCKKVLILINWQRRQLSEHVALCDIYQGQTPSQNCVPSRLFVRGSIHFQQLAQPGNNSN